MSAGQGISLVQKCIKELSQLRDEKKFTTCYDDARDLCTTFDGDPPKLPRKARSPKRYGTAEAFTHETPETYYRQKFYEIIDMSVTKLQERIGNKATPVLQSIERVIISGWEGKNPNDDDVNTICDFYGDDLDKFRLQAQLQTLENIPDAKSKGMSFLGESNMKAMIPQVIKLLRLYLTCAATTATAERSFSQLRRLKTYIRSTMTQKRLNHFAILSAHQEHLDNLDMRTIVNLFISKNTMRRNAFKLLQ